MHTNNNSAAGFPPTMGYLSCLLVFDIYMSF